VQHALRAFTPRDQKAVKSAAETFRPNPQFSTAELITTLGVGEALVSTLQAGGVPGVVEHTRIRPPRSRMGAITAEERSLALTRSPFRNKYDTVVDRESAYEMLCAPAVAPAPPAPAGGGALGNWWEKMTQQAPATPPSPPPATAPARRSSPAPAARGPATARASNRQGVVEAAVKSVIRSAGSQVGREVGRQLLRGVLGSLVKSR
jgi:DNA helicase HerA-like ATPase